MGKGNEVDLSYVSSDELVHELHRRIGDGDKYIAMKIWQKEDIENVLEQRDDTGDVTVQDVLNTGKLNVLNDCTDQEWQIIADAVDAAVEHSLKSRNHKSVDVRRV